MMPLKIFRNKIIREKKLLSEAMTQYERQDKTAAKETPEHHILLLLVRNIIINGTSYKVSFDDEKIFLRAAENFRKSVSCFSCGNVRIILHTEEIQKAVICCENRSYLIFEDIAAYLDEFYANDPFDSVIAVTAECGYTGAVTTLSMFQWKKPCYGFTHSVIVSSDKNLLNAPREAEYPFLVTTNFFIHEWLHQLEGYRNKISGIIYPFTHIYTSDCRNPSEPWQLCRNYSWDTEYFSDKEKYPYAVEPYITSFYRAVLSAEVMYKTEYMPKGRFVGMYPLFWKISPRAILSD